MNNYLFQFIIFLFVYFTQIQSDSTETYISSETTMSTATTVSHATSQPSSPSLASTTISTLTSNEPDGTNSPSVTSASTMNSSTYITSMGASASTELFTSSNTLNPSTYTTPTGTTASMGYSTSSYVSTGYSTSSFASTGYSSMTTQSINITVNLTYKYYVNSSSPLQSGYTTTNATILASVQVIVSSSFNLTNFTITVISVEIVTGQAKTINNFEMITNILFTSSRSDCDETCIKNSQLSTTPKGEFMLLGTNGSLVNASATSGPSLVSTSTTSTATTPIVNYPTGESPPGVAGRLGMGLGITFFGILVIVLIAYLYRKYGCNNLRRRRPLDYELTNYNQRLSV